MARIARVVAPDLPYHVTQRGNRRQTTFFHEEDYGAYLRLMAEWCGKRSVEVWAYCLMPNHVHLIAVTRTEDGLRRALLAGEMTDAELWFFRHQERTGRPLGTLGFVARIEGLVGRVRVREKAAPKTGLEVERSMMSPELLQDA